MYRLSTVVLAGAAVLSLAIPPAIAASVSDADVKTKLGSEHYQRFCAACHGASGLGDGPVAEHMSTRPADLTRLGARFGKPLDEDALARTIDGRERIGGHGVKTMPVWGVRLDDWVPEMPGSQAAKATTIELIVAYLKSIQRSE